MPEAKAFWCNLWREKDPGFPSLLGMTLNLTHYLFLASQSARHALDRVSHD
jgi:hypothetical protein